MLVSNPMMMKPRKDALNVEDVFQTSLYTGDGVDETVINGINNVANDNLIWFVPRSTNTDAVMYRTADDAYAPTTSTAVETTATPFVSPNPDGFYVNGSSFLFNALPRLFAAHNFVKSPRFFEMVRYTGNGSSRVISHSLGVAPGYIMIKRLDATGSMPCYHRGVAADPETDFFNFVGGGVVTDDNTYWNDNAPTPTQFSLGSNSNVNASGGSFVAYLFAHDPAPDGVIQCGSYIGNGSTTGPIVSLGWEPQFLIIKRTGSRSMAYNSQVSPANPRQTIRYIDGPNLESTSSIWNLDFLPDGFQLLSSRSEINLNAIAHTFLAIRASA